MSLPPSAPPSQPPCLNLPPLTVDKVLPQLCTQLAQGGNAVLCAPPGAGKTTRVPLALLHAPWLKDKSIVMLEPRRLAAKSAARHMAALLGEQPGQRVGYRMRLENRVGPDTRILVVTEGVLTRMLQDDAALENVACVIFDEFHERSLHADTGLAFCLDVQAALRPQLRLLVMSATLDCGPVAHLLGQCSVHISEGRLWPVDIRYMPPPPQRPLEQHMASVICTLLAREPGSLLAFLPGTAEIRRVEALLRHALPPDTMLYPLYGDLPPALQDAALTPCPPHQRKVVLATSIAETSLTIEGVRIVVDAGLARTQVFDPSTGMGQLVTSKLSLAEATQRAGRAGRMEAGVACRLWHEGENVGLRPFARPEILEADLTPLLLQCLLWGVTDPTTLSWLDTPPVAALAEAKQSLHNLGATDKAHRLTAYGRQLARLPLHPRLAHMVLQGAARHCVELAACLAALLESRIPPAQGGDVQHVLEALCTKDKGNAWQHKTRQQALQIARSLNMPLGSIATQVFFNRARQASAQCGVLLALAWPQWVAQHTGHNSYRLRNGRQACIAQHSPLAAQAFLAVAALDARAHANPAFHSNAHLSRSYAPAEHEGRAHIYIAAPLNENQLWELHAAEIEKVDKVVWDPRQEAVLARRQTKLGALLLADVPLPDPQPHLADLAVLEGIRSLGLQSLPWSEDLRQWQARVELMRSLEGHVWPTVHDAALLDELQHWLLPFLHGIRRRSQFKHLDMTAALTALLTWDLRQRLDKEMPTHMDVPSGSHLRVDYTAPGGPVLAVKLQEMFGCAMTPCLAGGRLPLTLHLNSPAGRPLQVTQDLASFWQQGYAAVRAEMRGRYPKHPWPDNPATALPTRHTKARLAKMQGHKGKAD